MDVDSRPVHISSLKIKYDYLLRPLTQAEYLALKESIRQNGLLEKIKVSPEGVILDGHHRLKICRELGIEPQFEVKVFNSELEEQLYVMEVNAKRRHLNAFELVELGLKRKEVMEKMGRLRQKAQQHIKSGTPVPHDTRVHR